MRGRGSGGRRHQDTGIVIAMVIRDLAKQNIGFLACPHRNYDLNCNSPRFLDTKEGSDLFQTLWGGSHAPGSLLLRSPATVLFLKGGIGPLR